MRDAEVIYTWAYGKNPQLNPPDIPIERVVEALARYVIDQNDKLEPHVPYLDAN